MTTHKLYYLYKSQRFTKLLIKFILFFYEFEISKFLLRIEFNVYCKLLLYYFIFGNKAYFRFINIKLEETNFFQASIILLPPAYNGK